MKRDCQRHIRVGGHAMLSVSDNSSLRLDPPWRSECTSVMAVMSKYLQQWHGCTLTCISGNPFPLRWFQDINSLYVAVCKTNLLSARKGKHLNPSGILPGREEREGEGRGRQGKESQLLQALARKLCFSSK